VEAVAELDACCRKTPSGVPAMRCSRASAGRWAGAQNSAQATSGLSGNIPAARCCGWCSSSSSSTPECTHAPMRPWRGPGAQREEAWRDISEACCATETGDLDRADSLFAHPKVLQDARVAPWYIRHLLRAGRRTKRRDLGRVWWRTRRPNRSGPIWRSPGGWLRGAGHHTNHIHPQGWLSSAFYVSVASQELMGPAPAGWLALGEPPAELGLDLPPLRMIEPKPGRLVLFPSIMWHGTVPFAGGERLSVAFDVAPPA
jgi:hypothetical protein